MEAARQRPVRNPRNCRARSHENLDDGNSKQNVERLKSGQNLFHF